MFTITSKNRTAAKRLLNNWHDSRAVLRWTLHELQSGLLRAINEGLITRQGIERVLAKQSEREEAYAAQGGDSDSRGDDNGESNPGQDESESAAAGSASDAGEERQPLAQARGREPQVHGSHPA